MDQHVSKRLFQECIRGLLRDATVILVTHQLQYLSQCDFVVFIQKGTLRGAGSYDTLLRNEPDFNALIKTHVGKHSQETESKPEVKATAKPEYESAIFFLPRYRITKSRRGEKGKGGEGAKAGGSGQLIMAEDKSGGAVDSYAVISRPLMLTC